MGNAGRNACDPITINGKFLEILELGKVVGECMDVVRVKI